MTRPRPATRAARAAVGVDREYGAVIPPLYLSANFTFEAPGRPRSYDYTRSGNPTRDHLAHAIAELEEGAGYGKNDQTSTDERASSHCLDSYQGANKSRAKTA